MSRRAGASIAIGLSAVGLLLWAFSGRGSQGAPSPQPQRGLDGEKAEGLDVPAATKARTSAVPEGLTLRFESEAGIGLPNATLSALDSHGESLELRSDANGSLVLDCRLPAYAEVGAPGYARTAFVLTSATDEPRTVVLPRAGHLRIDLLGRDSSSPMQRAYLVPGLEYEGLEQAATVARYEVLWKPRLLLAAALRGDRAAIDPSQALLMNRAAIRSLAEAEWYPSLAPQGGSIGDSLEWDDIPSGPYRWVCKGSLAMAVEPKHEEYVPRGMPVPVDKGRWEKVGVSGEFDVPEQAVHHIVLDGMSLGRFVFSFPTIHEPRSEAQIAVSLEDPFDGGGWRSKTLGRYVPDASGILVLDGLRPGLYSYTARWMRGPREMCFARGYEEIGPGESRKVALEALEGWPVRIEAAYVSEGGEIIQPVGPAVWRMALYGHGDLRPDESIAFNRIELRVGEELTLCGLAEGSYSLRVRGAPDWPGLPEEVRPESDQVKFAYRVPDQVDWKVHVPVLAAGRLRLTFPFLDEPASAMALHANLATKAGWQKTVTCWWDESTRAFEGEVQLAPGTYQVYATMEHEGEGYYYRGNFVYSAEDSKREVAEMILGVTVKGIARDEDGEPLQESLLTARVLDPEVPDGGFELSCKVGPGGDFSFSSVPRGGVLEILPYGVRVEIPAEASTKDLGEVTLSR